MSHSFELAGMNDEENMFMSETPSYCTDSVVYNLTEFSADAVSPDEEEEPEGCGLDQQSTDDHTYNQAPLSYELQQGLRILKELMSDSKKSVNWLFMEPVDDSHPETADYYDKIKKPIWFGKMKGKFDNREYKTITQFVADFRQMLENCYRFNGPDHFVSRRAQKLETMMEQKLNLLSRELRQKTSISATSGDQHDDSFPVIPGMRRRSKAIVPHDSTALLNQLRVEEIQKEREFRKQQLMERKATLDAHIQGMTEWEDKLMDGQREQVKAMWELPSIGLFLFLSHYPLNIGEVPQFELERCLFMPRESSTLQRLMTSLLSTPFQRHKLEKTGMMPYRVWNEKLRDRMAPWFKLLKDSQDPYKVADKFGLDPFLFQVVGKKNPMKKKKFHELSLYQKVWVLKSLCDHCLETQESLVKTIESQYPAEQKEYRLGEDAQGNTYLHFPQFCGADVRIYRQAYIPEPQFDEPELEEEEEEEPPKIATKRKSEKKEISRDRSKSKEKNPVPKKKPKTGKTFTSEIRAPPTTRPSRLRQTIKTVLPVTTNEDSSSDNNEFESTEEDATQSESESRSESEEPEGCNDSGIDNNTPFKNILRNRIMDRDNFSETSSVDSDILWGVHRTRSGRIRYNGAMRMNNDFVLPNENSCEFDGTLLENSSLLPDYSSKNNLEKVSNSHFNNMKMAKNCNGTSDSENNSDMCHQKMNEHGDYSAESISNKGMISKTENLSKGRGRNPKNRKINVEKSDLQDRMSDSPTKEFQIGDNSNRLSPSQKIVDTNEDSSTSNDFSEIESQDSVLDGNVSDNSSQHKNDIRTISRIFDEKMNDKICGNESDTNSSFLNIPMETDGAKYEHEQNMTSTNSENSPKPEAAKISESNLTTFGEFSQTNCYNLDSSVNDTKVQEMECKEREVTLSNVNSDDADTDTEFNNEKMETDSMDSCSIKSVINNIQTDNVDSLHDNGQSLVVKEGGIPVNIQTKNNESAEKLDNIEIKNESIIEEHTVVKTEISEELEYSGKTMATKEEGHIYDKESTEVRVDVKEEIMNNFLDNGEGIMEETVIYDVKGGMEEETVPSDIKEELEEGIVLSVIKAEIKEEAELLDLKEDVKEELVESDDEEDDTELVLGPEIGMFELVAQSVEDLKNLVEKFAEQEPYTVEKGKKLRIVKPPQRKKCVVQLHNRLVYLLKELEPWEQKLVQATKKARLKMKKEYEYYDEKDDDGWESDHSESTNSATEDNNMYHDTSPVKQRITNIPKDNSLLAQNDDSRTSEDCGEWDISLRGRIRKRRIIPNNVEDQGLSKKRKGDSLPLTSTHVPNILSHGKPIQATANMISLVTSSPSQSGGQSPGHLLLHTSGGQTYYTGLNEQSLSSLRMLSHSKQTAHPIIQQLLRQPGMTSPRPLVNTTVSSTSQSTPSGSKSTVRPMVPSQKQAVSSAKGTQQAGKVQYFAANINSLPPAVVQQLIKSNALTIQGGNNQQGIILLTAVNPAESESDQGAKATLTLQNPVTVKTSCPVQQVASSSVSVSTSLTLPSQDKVTNNVQTNQKEVNNKLSESAISDTTNQLNSNQPLKMPQTSVNISNIQSGQLLVQQGTSNIATGISTSVAQQPVMSLKQPVQIANNIQTQGVQSVPLSLSQASQQKVILTQNPAVNPTTNQGIRLQNIGQNIGMNIINPGGYILNPAQTQGVSLQLNPTVNIGGQGTLNIGGQGLTLQQIQALALQGINLQGISLQGSNIVVQPDAGLRIQNPANGKGQITVSTATSAQNIGSLSNLNSLVMPSHGITLPQNVNSDQTDAALKGLLNTASCSISGLCPPISPVFNSVPSSFTTSIGTELGSTVQGMELPSSPVFGVPISPGRSQCKYASNVTVKTLLEARKPSFTETSPENHGTIVVQSTAVGVKKLKLPSKAALDSAIQTVVTEVKTSLPTMNMKVPSPVTMPSIQPRRNITKTIQSMKVPIPTTPKVEAKTTGPITVQISPSNSLQPMSPVVGQPNIALASPLQSGILNLNQLNNGNQIMLTNLKSNSNIPTGQNVVQGYLTPQGLIIPSANFKNLQNMQKVDNSNVVGNTASGVEQTSSSSLQTGIQSSASPVTNSILQTANNVSENYDPKSLNNQNSRDLKHLQNVQDLRNVAAINSNLVPQLGSQQFVQKPAGITVSKNQVPTGNFVYLSPSANLQPGSQILLNANQPLTPLSFSTQPAVKSETVAKTTTVLSHGPSQSRYTAANVAIGNSVQNSVTKPFMSLPLAAMKTEPAKNTVISLPLATAMADPIKNAIMSLPLAAVRADQTSNNFATKIQPPMVNTFANNATLLSHLNSPVLKASVNQFSTTTAKTNLGNSPLLASSSTKVNGQNRLTINTDVKSLNIQQPIPSPFQTPTMLQRPVAASPLTKQAPVVINQQGSSSEIIKQLAAAQVSGTPIPQIANPQASNLTLASGNKLMVRMPGQTNQIGTTLDGKMMLQLPGQLPLNTNTSNQGKMVIPVSRLGQATSSMSSVSQESLNTVPATSLANKVMIQVPVHGQSQPGATMLLISPQKHFTLGSQKSVNNVVQCVPQQSQSVQHVPVGIPNNPGTPKFHKDQEYLQQAVPKLGKVADFPILKGQNTENVFKFSASSVNNMMGQTSTTQQGIGLIQQNTQKVITPLVLPGNKLSVVSINSVTQGLTSSAKSTSNLQTTVNQTQAKPPGTPQKLFLYNINGQLVTAQGVPVTVDNGILKILPQPKIQMSNFNLPKSPPASSKPVHHGNVPISPKPGQSITNTQQAYLNVLTCNANITSTQPVQPFIKTQPIQSLAGVGMPQSIKTQQSVSMVGIGSQQPMKTQPSYSLATVRTQQQVKTTTSHLLAGIGTSQPKSAVKNLNTNLNLVQATYASASNFAKQTVSVSTSSAKTVNINATITPEICKQKPSFGFVVMPETGGQTQIVFPQSNIHSNKTTKALVNNVQSSAISSPGGGSIPSVGTSIYSPVTNRTLVKNSSAKLAQPLKMNNSAPIVKNTIVTSTKSDQHSNMNGQKDTTINSPALKNAGKPGNARAVDAEEAALNLLSLANQRFSS